MTAFDRACAYFDAERQSGDAQYILHFPRQRTTYLGLGCHRSIRYRRSGFSIATATGIEHRAAVAEPVAAVRDLLDPAYPSFWMISPDLHRATADPELPLLLCVQPAMEIAFTDFGRTAAPSLSALPELSQSGWETQSDEVFLQRLMAAISALQSYPQGKMIVTRAYQRPVGQRDPLSLFRHFAQSEPSAAGSHFLRVDGCTSSLGCSPENVFETRDGRLYFDVVAGTRGISPDPETDARWLSALQNDPKERREHLMAFERYKARMAGLVNPGSLQVEQQLEVLQLGNVRHLYSRMSGELRPEWDWLKLLSTSSPALTSYPEALQASADNPDEPLRFYGGVLGRVAAGGGEAAFFLNLRAALVREGTLYTQGGVGVIAESEPDKELLEVKNKLRGLMQAINRWEGEAIPPQKG